MGRGPYALQPRQTRRLNLSGPSGESIGADVGAPIDSLWHDGTQTRWAAL